MTYWPALRFVCNLVLPAAVLPILALAIGLFVLATPETMAQQTDSDGQWVNLFNGQDLTGWTQKGGKARYTVANGMIVGSTVPNTPNSFLCTEKEYSDFELKLEFKVDPALNSGIQIRSNSLPEYQNGRVHGYQVEIDPSIRAWSGGIYDESRRGWLFDLKKNPQARYVFRQNEWNQYRILAKGDSIKTWINGIPAADLKDDMTSTGFIALQVHGVGGRKDPLTVQWKNIQIREPGAFAAASDLPAETTTDKNSNFEPVKVADGFRFAEGPALGPDGKIYFTDIPNEKIHAFDPGSGTTTVHRSETGKANGLVWTPHDELLACEGATRRISIQSQDGKAATLVAEFDGKRLNSPNDITLDGQGGFYFTDPRYGDSADLEMDVRGVYYVDRQRKITRVIDDLKSPNGIEMSVDATTLFVADNQDGKVYAFDVRGPGKLANRNEFASLACDGMTIDSKGNLYFTSSRSVHVYSPDGDKVRQIEFPETPTNATFGGPNNATLFVTCPSALYKVETGISGGRAFANPAE